MDNMELPFKPYAGTSGWSGSTASRDRAVEEDQSGVTGKRQKQTLIALNQSGYSGLTWKELGELFGWHHGQASGCLSVLHLEGMVARLAERRNRCSIYVIPEFVNGRNITERKTNTCTHCGGEL